MVEARRDLRRERRLAEHLGEIEQQVVVIEHALALLGLDVGREQAAQRLFVRRRPGKVPAERLLERNLRVGDARIDRQTGRLGREALLLLRQAGLVAAERHQVGRILAVVDGEGGIEADARRVFAQQPRADRMEGAAVARRRRRGGLGGEAAGEDALDAAVELGRGAAREGRQHDALGVDAGKHEMGEAMGERRRLADPRAGDHQQRLLAMLDRQPLRVVQRVGRVGANRGERHGARGTRFGVCSQRLHLPGGGRDEGLRRSAGEARRNKTKRNEAGDFVGEAVRR